VDTQKDKLMTIMLKDILSIEHPEHYKLHLAGRNEDWVNPLDEYVAARQNWHGWNEWRGNRNDWTRPYILSFLEFYPKRDRWLFGGIFKVLERGPDKYKLEVVSSFDKCEGRLLAGFKRYQGMRGRAFYLENHIDQFEIAEMFPSAYSGEAFCGYGTIQHDFGVMESIFKNERHDWKAALSSVKGIYVIFDRSNGKKYVGAAYSEGGIWSRWASYIGTGHGWTDELTKVVSENGIDYARKNFVFSVLEIVASTTPDPYIIEREGHWKRVLLAREYGYNKN